MNNNEKYEALKLDRQLCFPLYAVSKEIVRKYKPFLDEVDLSSETDKRDVYAVITEKGLELRDKACEIPGKLGACVPLNPDKAMTLYQILHEMMEQL